MSDFISNIITFLIIFYIISLLTPKKKQDNKTPKPKPQNYPGGDSKYRNDDISTNDTRVKVETEYSKNDKYTDMFDYVFTDEQIKPVEDKIISTKSKYKKSDYKKIKPDTESISSSQPIMQKSDNNFTIADSLKDVNELKKAIILTEIFNKPKFKSMKSYR